MSGMRQNIQYSLALEPKDRGEAAVVEHPRAEPSVAKPAPESPAVTEQLMEEVCDGENLQSAWKRVQRNQGSPGVDGMTIDDAKVYLREHWPSIRSQLLNGTYQPQPVKRRRTGHGLGKPVPDHQAAAEGQRDEERCGAKRKFLGFSISNDGSERRIAPKGPRPIQGADPGAHQPDAGTQSVADYRGADTITSSDGAATSASARPLARSRSWKRGSAEDCVRIFGGSGATGTIASKNCAGVAHQSSERRSRPARRRVSGACQDTRRSKQPCATTTSIHLVSPDCHVRFQGFRPRNPIRCHVSVAICDAGRRGGGRELSDG
jgi:hypothetical protein